MVEKFKVKYLVNMDENGWQYVDRMTRPYVGEAIELADGYWHCITEVEYTKPLVTLSVSKPCHTPEEAILVAAKLKHLPEGFPHMTVELRV